jgi:hypothetical protein
MVSGMSKKHRIYSLTIVLWSINSNMLPRLDEISAAASSSSIAFSLSYSRALALALTS